ncbi:twin-arginine translocase subunit TatC [Streptomyces sp. NBC_00510]
MPLVEHLRELRNRLAKSVLAIVVVAIVAAFYSQQLLEFLASPVPKCGPGVVSSGGNCAIVTFDSLTAPFALTMQVCFMAGVIGASPVWLYQLWAFIAPGLHRNERKYTYMFVGAALPLFLGGALLAYKIMPVSIKVLISFTPEGSSNLLKLDGVLDFTIRMVLVFGLAFELPLLLVMLNLVGMVSGRRMAGWWRAVVMGVFVFGAVATPTTDPVSMIALSGPIVVLYFGAVAFSLVNDRRRRWRNPDAELSDDEASELDLTPESIGTGERVTASVPEQAGPVEDGRRSGDFDDAT